MTEVGGDAALHMCRLPDGEASDWTFQTGLQVSNIFSCRLINRNGSKCTASNKPPNLTQLTMNSYEKIYQQIVAMSKAAA